MAQIESLFRKTGAALVMAGAAAASQATDVLLSWTASPSPNVVNYEICAGNNSRFNVTTPGTYPYCYETGSAATSAVGQTYKETGLNVFAMKSISADGQKSTYYSNEASIYCATTCESSLPSRMRVLSDVSNTATSTIVVEESSVGTPVGVNNIATPSGYSPVANNPNEMRGTDNSFWLMSKLNDSAAIQQLDRRGVQVGTTTISGPYPNNVVIAGDRNAASGYGGLLLQNTKKEIVPLPLNSTGTRLYPPPATTYNPLPDTDVTWKSYQLQNDGSQLAFGKDSTGRIGYLVKWYGDGTGVPLKTTAVSIVSKLDMAVMGMPAGLAFMDNLAANADGSAVRLAAKGADNKLSIISLSPTTLQPTKISTFGPYPGVTPVAINRGTAGTAQMVFTYGAGNSAGLATGTIGIWNLNANDQNTGTTRYAPSPLSATVVSRSDRIDGVPFARNEQPITLPQRPLGMISPLATAQARSFAGG